MATATKQKPTVDVVYRGKREELQGHKFRIPAGLANPAKFIEQEYDKQQAEAAVKAEQERQAAEAEAQRLADAEAEAEAMVDVPEPMDVPAPIAAAESSQEQLALAASLSNVTGSLLTQSREVEQLQAQVTEQQQTIEQLIGQLNTAGIEKAEALKLVKNNQLMMNQLVTDTSLQIQALQGALNEADTKLNAYLVVMQDNAETVEKASRITDDVKVIARDVAEEEAERQLDMTFAAINATLRASGVTRSQFLQILNSGYVQGEQAVIATKAELREYVRMSEKFAATEADIDERTNENSRTASDIIGHGGGVVKEQG